MDDREEVVEEKKEETDTQNETMPEVDKDSENVESRVIFTKF